MKHTAAAIFFLTAVAIVLPVALPEVPPADAQTAICGDHVRQAGEDCDPPGVRCGSEDGEPLFCTEDCFCDFDYCGNQGIGPNEQCDPPSSRCAPPFDDLVCDQSCQCTTCGNGVLDAGEQCDTPNTFCSGAFDGQVCTDSCQCIPDTCGNGLQGAGEECEVQSFGQPCASPFADFLCGRDCKCRVPLTCGDGDIDPNEQCDPPVTLCASPFDGLACDDACQCVPDTCGNRVTGPAEQCDPPGGSGLCGSPAGGFICNFDCQCELDRCGNLITGPAEQCDPPGTLCGSPAEPICGDACQCDGPIPCGNGIVERDLAETCDPPGSLVAPVLGGEADRVCRDDCSYCGDRIVQRVDQDPFGSLEQCDDGNDLGECPIGFDNCRNDCRRPICQDPARILFRRDPKPDELKLHGLILVAPGDPTRSTVSILLENSNGPIYAAELLPGAVARKGRALFVTRNLRARHDGGVALFKVKVRRNRASTLTFKAYGELSAATLPHMRVTVSIGAQAFATEADWRRLRRGWNLPDVVLR